MSIQREYKCPDCKNELEIHNHAKPNTVFGICLNKECNSAWFITQNSTDASTKFQLAKKYEEDPIGKRLQSQLGLDSLTIIFRKSEEPPHIYHDVHIKKFITFYRSENSLIHELGHLIIDSNPEHYKVDKPWEQEDRHPIDNIINAIVDIMVNYNLVVNHKMEEFYDKCALEEILVDRILKDIKENKKIDPKLALGDYCYIYLELNYYLKKKDKTRVSKKWKSSLKKLRQRIMYELKKSIEWFKNIEEQLNRIEFIDDFKNLKKISNYILRILLEIDLWDKRLIYKKLKERFL